MKLWALLTAELGTAFRTQFGEPEGKVFDFWRKELSEFSEAQLVDGFNKFKNSGKTYMSLNVFRNHCKKSHQDLGLPSAEQSFKAVILAEWAVLPEAFKVIFAPHRYSLRQLSAIEAFKQFKPIYEDAVRRLADGEVIKMPERPLIEMQKPKISAVHKNGLKGSEAIKHLLNGINYHA